MSCFFAWQKKTKATAKQAENDSAEPPRCEICGKPIQPEGKHSVQEFIAATRESVGKQACVNCLKKMTEARTDEPAPTVSSQLNQSAAESVQDGE